MRPRRTAAEIIADAKERGLIRGPGKVVVKKDGEPLTAATSQTGTAKWVEVTPAMAEAWLENNFRNRPLSEDVVVAYARDMKSGQWVPTHQGIAFNENDDLIDGQHRLHAIVRSGVTVRMMVTFGLKAKIAGKEMTTMDAVDRGRTRSVADQLKIQHGMKDGSAISMVCMSLGSLCYGERTRRLSVGQVLEIYRAFEKAVNYVIQHRSRENGLKQAGVMAAFAFAIAAAPPSGAICEMYQCLRAGRGPERPPEGAIWLLRDFLTSPEAKLLTRGTDRGLAELCLQAIWLTGQGKKVAKLEPGQDGLKHYRGLQPDRAGKVAGIFKLPQ